MATGDHAPREGQILTGPLFSEPMRVETVSAHGPSAWMVGLVGTKSQQFRRVSLTKDQLATLTILSSSCSYDGDAGRLKLGFQHERSHGRTVTDVHEQNLGYDLTSLDTRSGELRLIEVKGISAAVRTILLTPNERRVAEDRRKGYWLGIDALTRPMLAREPEPPPFGAPPAS